ncbi:hypothetical protein CO038_03105 [Candidatus Pacearchaeota archaeon CG_4_9_14_0_2_um_filter_39_13]|nr:AI-2E family transporter [Candidatus Pacearchaeota archaeon]OIO42142.1 MAG: hypothetical protein AUJ64_04200 [Candidatus Pacearchaeota archaeon CG1_02_39_14]PJC44555.1 MAG: hypothetical protein CO038_03105 [Candidatus Pacearchaeota archaeon CG_4_9_14_0_2_um_filter_39_13]
MKIEEIKKYAVPVAIIILAIISFFIIKDFLIPLLAAFILAFLIRPIYKSLEKRMPRQLAAIISILLVALVVLVPLVIIVIAVLSQLSSYLSSALLISLIRRVSQLDIFTTLGINLSDIRGKLTEIVISFLGDLTASLPAIAISLVIFFLAMYYALIDWEKLVKKVKAYLPSKNKEKVSIELAKVTKSVLYGSILIAFIQFVISLLGFWIIGIDYYLILAAIIGLFSFIPGLGPAIVWIPAAIIFAMQGKPFASAGTIIMGLILSIYVDTILRAQISGRGTKVHPITMLVGIIGGLALFGIAGFVLGPLILNYTITLIDEIVQD